MLKELLLEISASEYISKTLLAAKLGRPKGLIEDGLAQLVRLGYLAEGSGSSSCAVKCGKCPYASLCGQDPIRTLTITTAGQKYIDRH
jgi:hypothetical protein